MEVIGSIYTNVSDDFQNGIIGGCISRCVKAEKHDLGVVLMEEVKVIGQMDNTIDNTFESANRVYDIGGVSPTMNTCGGGGLQPKIIVAMRGRNPTKPSDRTPGIELEQTLEVNGNGTSNCLTSVQKDNLVLEKPNQLGFMDNGTGQHQSNTVYDEKALCPNITTVNGGGTQQIKVATQYRIRKLTPKECWRLMDFSDEDFEKAAEVNSNTQLYKQAGNSIVVNVLVAILGQILPGKENVYKNKI